VLLTALPATRELFPQFLDDDAGGGVVGGVGVGNDDGNGSCVAVAMAIDTGNISSCIHSHRAS
jgi:hypothetical protein